MIKSILISGFCLAFIGTNSAQNTQAPETKTEVKQVNEPTSEEVIDAIVELCGLDAGFPGGIEALQQYVQNNVSYPDYEMHKNIQGKVYVSFVVEKDGSISNVTVERSVSPGLDAEAVRLISNMPNWTPGQNHGELVRQRCRIPINFEITGRRFGRRK